MKQSTDEPVPRSKLSPLKRAGLVLLFLLGIGMVVTIAVLMRRYGVEQIRTTVNQFGLWGVALLLGLRWLSVVIPVISGTAYALVAGAIYGLGPGVLIIAIADFLACLLNFYLSKRHGRHLAQQMVGEVFMARIDRWHERHLERNFFLMTGLMSTGFFDFTSYGLGVTKLGWKRFLAILSLSIPISKPPFVAVGAGLAEGQRGLFFAAIGAIFLLAIGTAWLNRKKGLE
ncbi:MAG: VTT domain-containing protein [Synechococcales bacterium]|nr:VTT domain-containing protein [Synechococcales bacterium]